MKRSFSEINDCTEGDFFKGGENDSDGVENELESPETRARKRRRGQIEKKRRDRINSSLAELRQLVPAAFKKQGSTKLEKAEILQLTVEHLRGLKYGAEHTRGLAMTRAVDEHIPGHQECIPDSHLSLSAPVETAETAHVSPTSSTRRQIVNKINCLAALPGGHNGINPPKKTGLTLSTMETDKQLCSSTQTFTPLPLNAGRSEVCEMSQARKIRDWGLTVAFNCPSVLPLQRPGLGNVLQTPLIQAGPLIDWSMSLITKTNYSVPFPSSWSP